MSVSSKFKSSQRKLHTAVNLIEKALNILDTVEEDLEKKGEKKEAGRIGNATEKIGEAQYRLIHSALSKVWTYKTM